MSMLFIHNGNVFILTIFIYITTYILAVFTSKYSVGGHQLTAEMACTRAYRHIDSLEHLMILCVADEKIICNFRLTYC